MKPFKSIGLRVITAIILAAFFFAIVKFLPLYTVLGIFLGVLGLAVWEWSALMSLPSMIARALYVILILSLAGMLAISLLALPKVSLLLQSFLVAGPVFKNMMLCSAVFWFFLVPLCCWLYPACPKLWSSCFVMGAAGCSLFLIAWSSLCILMHTEKTHLLLGLIALSAAVDIGGYFVGSAYGRRRLAPALSPSKSWEGLLGGALLVGLVVFAGKKILWPFLPLPYGGLALTALVTYSATIGDLFESLWKRQAGVKDSGTLLPGHGGILDRVDGLLATLPLGLLFFLFVGG